MSIVRHAVSAVIATALVLSSLSGVIYLSNKDVCRINAQYTGVTTHFEGGACRVNNG